MLTINGWKRNGSARDGLNFGVINWNLSCCSYLPRKYVERRLRVAPRILHDVHCVECDDKLQYIIHAGSYPVSRLSQSENRYYDKMLLKQERLNETVRGLLNVDIKAPAVL